MRLDTNITMQYDCEWRWEDNLETLRLYSPVTINDSSDKKNTADDPSFYIFYSDAFEVKEISESDLKLEQLKGDDIHIMEFKAVVPDN